MINLAHYNLTDAEHQILSGWLSASGGELNLEGLWSLMDAVWDELGCSNRTYNEELYGEFYRHPVWLLNGIFTEHDDESRSHRRAIVDLMSTFSPECVVDFGGGFGTLARMMAEALPSAEIDICEPYPPRYGVESCRRFSRIKFVPSLARDKYDVLVSTDVLEHVQDPLALFAEMVSSVKPSGNLIVANCFYPVIKCHLPSTFHLRHNFSRFSHELGLDVVGPCPGSHAVVFKRERVVEPDWQRIRLLEAQSKRTFARHQFKERYVTPWSARLQYGLRNPAHYWKRLRCLLGASEK
jgi:hypothetical protein